ncbi:MAG TPA: hypothetical protein VFZ48_00740 [Candidatus Saccharimonadales bacterium]
MFDAIKEWIQNTFGEQVQQGVEETVQNTTEQLQDVPTQVTEQIEQVKEHLPGSDNQ